MLHLLSLHVGNIFFNVALSEFACRGYTIFILQLDKLMLQLLIDMCCCRENIFSGNVAQIILICCSVNFYNV